MKKLALLIALLAAAATAPYVDAQQLRIRATSGGDAPAPPESLSILITNPGGGTNGDFGTPVAAQTVTYTTGGGATSVTATCGGGCSPATPTPVGLPSGSFSVTLACSASPGTLNTIVVTAHKAATPDATDTLPAICFTSDTQNPVVVVLVPVEAGAIDAVTASASFVLSGTASDDVGVVSVTCSNDRGAPCSATGQTSWSATASSMPTGLNVITTIAHDAAGKQSAPVVRTINREIPLSIITPEGFFGSCVEDVTCNKTLTAQGGPSGGSYVWDNNGGGTTLNDSDADCAGSSLPSTGTGSFGVFTAAPGSTCSFSAKVTKGAEVTPARNFTINVVAASGSGAHSYFEFWTDPGTIGSCSGAVGTWVNCRVQLEAEGGQTVCAVDDGGCSLRSQAQLNALPTPDVKKIRAYSADAGGTVTVKFAEKHNAFATGHAIFTGAGALNGTRTITSVVRNKKNILTTSAAGVGEHPTIVTDGDHGYDAGDAIDIKDVVKDVLSGNINLIDGPHTVFDVPTSSSFRLTAVGKVKPITTSGHGGTVELTDRIEVAATNPTPGTSGGMQLLTFETDATAVYDHPGRQDAARMTLPREQASIPQALDFKSPSHFPTESTFTTIADMYYGRELRPPECGGFQEDSDWKSHMIAEVGNRYAEFRNSWTKNMTTGTECDWPLQDRIGPYTLRLYGTCANSDITKDLCTTTPTVFPVAYDKAITSSSLSETPIAITSSSVANPTVLTTATHGFTTGDVIIIAGHTGTTPDINGQRVVTVISPTTFSIPVNVTVGGGATGTAKIDCTAAGEVCKTIIHAPGGGLAKGHRVVISGHTSTPDLNGTWSVLDNVDADRFTIEANVTVAGSGGSYQRGAIHSYSSGDAWGLFQSNAAATPTGKNAIAFESYFPYVETWTRSIITLEMNVPDTSPKLDAWKTACNTAGGLQSSGIGSGPCSAIIPGVYTLITWIVCDETRDCQRIYYRLPWFVDVPINMPWQLRMNTSNAPNSRLDTVYAWFRNVMVFMGPGFINLDGADSAADIANNPTLLVKPVR